MNKLLIIIFFSSNIALASVPSKLEDQYSRLAKEYQSILASQLIHSMASSVKVDSLTGGGNAEQTYRSMLYEEYAKNLDLGLAEQIERSIRFNIKGVK